MSSARLLPVSWTFSALTTMVLSPQSIWGVKEGLCLPRSRIAIIEASRPKTRPSASISSHFLSMSDGLAENVFMARKECPAARNCCPARESRSCKRSAPKGQAMRWRKRGFTMAAILLEERTDGVLRLTLNRPEARNALSIELMTALVGALGRAADDRHSSVVVIAGAGAAFCAVHDLRELRQSPRRETYQRLVALCRELMRAIVRWPKPVIAEVRGVATAAGCQLVATCDLAVAAEEARFATPGVNIGLFCSTPMVALSRAVGRKAAMEMLLTGDLVDAATAKAIGLVNRVVPRAELRTATLALAQQIAAKSALTVAIGKEAFYRQAELGLADAYHSAAQGRTRNARAPDLAEGIGAFLDKRPPLWQDA